MKEIIKITEKELKKTIKESIKKVLSEADRHRKKTIKESQEESNIELLRKWKETTTVPNDVINKVFQIASELGIELSKDNMNIVTKTVRNDGKILEFGKGFIYIFWGEEQDEDLHMELSSRLSNEFKLGTVKQQGEENKYVEYEYLYIPTIINRNQFMIKDY